MHNRHSNGISVVPHRPEWQQQARDIVTALTSLLQGVRVEAIEHVGSTSVPGLAAKPILDIDVVVQRAGMTSVIAALEGAGYVHQGNLGVIDREAFTAPDEDPARNVYVCVVGTLHLRNHLAVRDILRRDGDLRERYGAVKLALAREPDMTIDRYLAGKSAMLQEILTLSDLTMQEKQAILDLNTST